MAGAPARQRGRQPEGADRDAGWRYHLRHRGRVDQGAGDEGRRTDAPGHRGRLRAAAAPVGRARGERPVERVQRRPRHHRVRGEPAQPAAPAAAARAGGDGHRPRLSHRLQGGDGRSHRQAAAHGDDLPASAAERRSQGAPGAGGAGAARQDQRHRHRQRHRQPRDRGAGRGADPGCQSPAPRLRDGQRGGRVGLLRVRHRPGGVPRPGRLDARRDLHRAAAAGSRWPSW